MSTPVKDTIENFFSAFPHRSYKKGEIMIHPDEQPAGAFYIKSGYAREYNISIDGVEITIHIFVPHAFFPMTWVISDIPNRYYYEALTDIEVYQAPKEAVISFLSDRPEVLYDLTRRLLHGLDKLTVRIEQLAHGKAYSKVVSSLLFLATHFGKAHGSGIIITEKFTHREIAAFAGIARETASREWEKLKEDRFIDYNSQQVIIPDIAKLKRELEEA